MAPKSTLVTAARDGIVALLGAPSGRGPPDGDF